MKNRCTNPHARGYANWGGRGILIYPPWLRSFESFLADVGSRPSSKHSLDRFPNNNGNYEPGNVRWATPQQQSDNKRKIGVLASFSMLELRSEIFRREWGISE